MSIFNLFDRITDESNKEADAIIGHLNGKGPRPTLEVMPGFEHMVAGAAMALERGAPHAFFHATDSKAEDHLRQYGHENRSFHTAVARVVNMHRKPGSDMDTSAEGVIRHIVTDVVNQGSAKKVEMAVKDSHPAFEEHLTLYELERLERGRMNPMHAKDIRYESYGNYSDVSTAGKHHLVDTFTDGKILDAMLNHQILLMARLAEEARRQEAATAKTTDNVLAEYHDFHRPLFRDVSAGSPHRAEWSAARDRVEELAAGDMPRNTFEAGVVTHIAVAGARENDHVTTEARMNALMMHQPGALTARVATTIEAEVLAVKDSRQRRYEEIDDVYPDPDHVSRLEAIAYRDYHRMEPAAQVGLYQEISHGDRVPGLMAFKIVEAAQIVEHDVDMRMDVEAGKARKDKVAATEKEVEKDAESDLKIYLDDKRDGPEGWTTVRNPYEFFQIWDERAADVKAISFDENLGHGEAKGSQVASYVWETIRDEPGLASGLKAVNFHSDDPAATRKFAAELREFARNTPGFPDVAVTEGDPAKTIDRASTMQAAHAMQAGQSR